MNTLPQEQTGLSTQVHCSANCCCAVVVGGITFSEQNHGLIFSQPHMECPSTTPYVWPISGGCQSDPLADESKSCPEGRGAQPPKLSFPCAEQSSLVAVKGLCCWESDCQAEVANYWLKTSQAEPSRLEHIQHSDVPCVAVLLAVIEKSWTR